MNIVSAFRRAIGDHVVSLQATRRLAETGLDSSLRILDGTVPAGPLTADRLVDMLCTVLSDDDEAEIRKSFNELQEELDSQRDFLQKR